MPFALFLTIVNSNTFLHNLLFELNIMFTLLLGLICIFVWDKNQNKFLSLIAIAGCLFLAHILNTDYGYWGVLLVFVLYLCRQNKVLLLASMFSLAIIKFAPDLIKYNFYYMHLILMISTFLAVIPILLYNGKQGKKIKYLLYAFYPIHLLVLYLIHIYTAL